MTEYRNVTVEEDGVIRGQQTLGRGDRWVSFSADADLLHIREALDRFPDELGEVIWSLQDGYGEPGYTPVQGWDWSGIRDSSPEAIQAMVTEAKRFLNDNDFDRLLGF